MNTNITVGFYGKLPVVGDFVSRRLPNTFINPWDKWLQSAITASREQLGSDWLHCYLTSPIWRFMLSPGLCGQQAVAGILMPSVDKAGRYYPFTVAALLEQSPELPLLLASGNLWFEQIEDAALTILEGSLDIAGFDQLIQRITPFSLPIDWSIGQQISTEKKLFYVAMDNPQQLSEAFAGLNAQLLNNFMSGYSLWSSIGAEQVQQPVLIACEGLPAINQFSSFLTGKMDVKNCSMYAELNRKPSTIQTKPIMAIPEEDTTENLSLSSILATNNSEIASSTWNSWAITDTGKRRKHNEDSLLNKPEAGLWVVADGMGGHKAGDVASQLIVSSLNKLAQELPLDAYIEAVKKCLQEVNSDLQQLAAKEYSHHLIGSTVVVLISENQQGAFLWAGDSRLYRLRNQQLQQLTQDHCIAEEESSAWSVKSSNIITRAVGAHETLELDVGTTEMLAGDIFLLCSDGLDKEMSLNEIEHVMKTHHNKDIADTLVREVLARGARDNVTVIVVAV